MTHPKNDVLKQPVLTVGDAFTQMRLQRAHAVIGVVLFITFVIEAWEQVGLIYVSQYLAEDFKVSMAQVGTALGAVALGMVPGTLLWGALVERLGKKRVSVLSLSLYGLVALAAALSPNFTLFVVLRFLSGVAFGGVYAVTFPYFMELLPTNRRGQATVAMSMGFPVGTLLCIAVSLMFGSVSWRIVAVIAAVAAAWAFMVWRFVPETPYWLVRKERQAEAKSVLAKLGISIADHQTLVLDPEKAGEDSAATVRKMRVAPLLTMIIIISFCYNWGYWGLQSWLPIFLQEKGLSISGSLGFVALSQLVAVPGYLSAAWLTRRLGRRWVFVAFAVGATLGGLIFAAAAGPVQMYIGNFMYAFFVLGSWGIWNTWSGEALPTKARGYGYATSSASLLLANAIAVPIVGWMIDSGWSITATVGSIAAFMAIGILTTFGIPETEGKALR
ncbi:MFS transporter [Brevibacterium luteolum]|uniref:MFS transporter n=1 Tax=Brevibacterium luteolum TaxID=199591 RepID=A0A6G8KZ57_9MICO|nr:MFS transporter [Brevibacterium luteolum]QIN29790.1 MFS transporter [Brevibacterium luteolum]